MKLFVIMSALALAYLATAHPVDNDKITNTVVVTEESPVIKAEPIIGAAVILADSVSAAVIDIKKKQDGVVVIGRSEEAQLTKEIPQVDAVETAVVKVPTAEVPHVEQETISQVRTVPVEDVAAEPQADKVQSEDQFFQSNAQSPSIQGSEAAARIEQSVAEPQQRAAGTPEASAPESPIAAQPSPPQQQQQQQQGSPAASPAVDEAAAEPQQPSETVSESASIAVQQSAQPAVAEIIEPVAGIIAKPAAQETVQPDAQPAQVIKTVQEFAEQIPVQVISTESVQDTVPQSSEINSDVKSSSLDDLTTNAQYYYNRPAVPFSDESAAAVTRSFPVAPVARAPGFDISWLFNNGLNGRPPSASIAFGDRPTHHHHNPDGGIDYYYPDGHFHHEHPGGYYPGYPGQFPQGPGGFPGPFPGSQYPGQFPGGQYPGQFPGGPFPNQPFPYRP